MGKRSTHFSCLRTTSKMKTEIYSKMFGKDQRSTRKFTNKIRLPKMLWFGNTRNKFISTNKMKFYLSIGIGERLFLKIKKQLDIPMEKRMQKSAFARCGHLGMMANTFNWIISQQEKRFTAMNTPDWFKRQRHFSNWRRFYKPSLTISSLLMWMFLRIPLLWVLRATCCGWTTQNRDLGTLGLWQQLFWVWGQYGKIKMQTIRKGTWRSSKILQNNRSPSLIWFNLTTRIGCIVDKYFKYN